MKEWNKDNDEMIRKYNYVHVKNKKELAEYTRDYNRNRREHQKSFGGRPEGINMSLLKISMDLFN